VRYLGLVKDDVLAENYARADVLVIPSYHEGFCVPVVEAFASGAYVVAYDSSNLPNVVAGLGSLVPTGDVGALSTVLVDLARRFQAARERDEELILPAAGGEVSEAAWRVAVAHYVSTYSYEAFKGRFAELVMSLAAR
jgi:glycosyltransferase involved in cell wall biosynthesis